MKYRFCHLTGLSKSGKNFNQISTACIVNQISAAYTIVNRPSDNCQANGGQCLEGTDAAGNYYVVKCCEMPHIVVAELTTVYNRTRS